LWKAWRWSICRPKHVAIYKFNIWIYTSPLVSSADKNTWVICLDGIKNGQICKQSKWCAKTQVTFSMNVHGCLKRSLHFQKLFYKNDWRYPCPVYGWKVNLSKFWYRWSEAAHHWGCGCCYVWHAATSVGRAGLLIWHLPLHTWGSHRELVSCENNFDSYPFSLYIAPRHMFSSTCKINVWKSILLF
jgi:hypothetical protein